MRTFCLWLKLRHFILQFTIVKGLVICEFILCEPIFWVSIYRVYHWKFCFRTYRMQPSRQCHVKCRRDRYSGPQTFSSWELQFPRLRPHQRRRRPRATTTTCRRWTRADRLVLWWHNSTTLPTFMPDNRTWSKWQSGRVRLGKFLSHLI